MTRRAPQRSANRQSVRKDRFIHGLPFAKWPATFKEAWTTANPADPLKAARLSPSRRAPRHRSTGNKKTAFVLFFGTVSRDAPEAMLGEFADSVTPSTIMLFVDDLFDRCSPNSIFDYLSLIRRGVESIAPDRQWRWLRRRAKAIPGRGGGSKRPRPKTKSRQLLAAAQARMKQLKPALRKGAHRKGDIKLQRLAEAYRDSLMMAFLSVEPLRLANMRELNSKTFVRDLAGYMIAIRAQAAKGRKPRRSRFPKKLVTHMDFYMETVRPLLARQIEHDGLWVSRTGSQLTPIAIHQILERITISLVGERLTAHDFRYAAADATVEADMPLEDAGHLLHHVRGSAVTEQKYIKKRRAKGRLALASTLAARLAKSRRVATRGTGRTR
ncbi:MAG: tyrosine-type recombinase/integrase [Beijerinckiaceae bacterium]